MTTTYPNPATVAARAVRHAKRVERMCAARTVPDLDDAELLEHLRNIHRRCHTAAGTRAHDESRKSAVLLGIQGLAVRDELARRGTPIDIDCPRWCSTEV